MATKTATKRYRNPNWWSKEYDSAWDRVKAAFRRDWEQTKHDFGGDAPDLDQDVDDTIGQAVGSRPIPPGNLPNFDADEPAYRYGYGARLHYGEQYPSWNPDLEGQLEEEWNSLEGGDWRSRRAAIRRGWEYDT